MKATTDLFGNLLPESQPQKQTCTPFRQWQLREGNVLYRAGTQHMSSTHLLAHLIRNQRLAEQLMEHFGDLVAVADASVVELKQVNGVGIATAETIKVAFELSRRLTQGTNGTKPRIYSPKDVYELLREEMIGLKQEILKVLLCDTKNQVEHVETVFVGSLNCSVIHPREIFKAAIRQSAASIIIAHNHPSGDPQPSKEDIHATKQLRKAGEHIQIPILDHVIIGDGSYVSLKEEGIL